jgi:hypothetical protein
VVRHCRRRRRRCRLPSRAKPARLSGVGFFQDRVPMRSSPHPPSPLLPHGERFSHVCQEVSAAFGAALTGSKGC